MFKKGDKVAQIQAAPVQGVVAGFDIDQESGDVQVRVEWPNEDGGMHVRHFPQDQLEAIE